MAKPVREKKSVGKVVLGFFLVVIIIGVVVYAYDQWADTMGNPTFRDAFQNASSIVGENEDLKKELDEVERERDDLASQTGVPPSLFFMGGVVILLIGVLAYGSSKAKEGSDRSREEVRAQAVGYALDRWGLKPSSAGAHPRHLQYTRLVDDVVEVGGTRYDFFGFVTRTDYLSKRFKGVYTYTVCLKANDSEVVMDYPGFSPMEAKEDFLKVLEKRNRAVAGGTGDGEALAALNETVMRRVADRLAEEEML